MSGTRTRRLPLLIAVGILALTGCTDAEPEAAYTPEPTPLQLYTVTPTPTPTPADIVITFYGSDIQVIGSTYDDTPAVEDVGRVADGYQVIVPPGTGFSWGAVSFNEANDAGCRVTQGEVILLDNTAPNQLSAMCTDYEGF